MKRTLFILLTISILSSCNKDDEYISFMLVTENSEFNDTTAVLRGLIIAPGKVAIQDCGFAIYSPYYPDEYSYISLGELKTPGKIEVKVDTLRMGYPYNFYLYAKSQGKFYQSSMDSAMTTEGGFK